MIVFQPMTNQKSKPLTASSNTHSTQTHSATQIEHLKQLSNRLDSITTGTQPKRFRNFFDLPFDEIFSLLKDLYQGKTNEMLQEILDEADIQLSMHQKNPDDPKSARELEVKITLASEVIDKYADLLELAIGQNHSPEQGDIITKSKDELSQLGSKCNRIALIKSMLSLKDEVQELKDTHLSSHCFPFFCSGRLNAKLDSINQMLEQLISPGFITSEIQGGLILLHSQLGKIFESAQEQREINQTFERSFDAKFIHLLNDPDNLMLVGAFNARAKVLNFKWPEHFSMHVEGLNDASNRASKVI